jgi:hypothetical protein
MERTKNVIASIQEASGLPVAMGLQIKLERADGTRVKSLLKVLDVLKASGFEFLHGLKGERRADGVFLIVEAIYTDLRGELLAAITRATAILGEECIYEDDTYRGSMLRLAKDSEAAALEVENEKLRAKQRARIASERKQEAADASAWARYDAQQAA